MKKFLLLILVLFLLSCDKREFKNPFDPDTPIDISSQISDITLIKTTNNKLKLIWTINSPINFVYYVSRKVDQEPWQDFYKEINPGVFSFLDYSVTGNKTYSYRIMYKFDDNISYSEIKSVFLSVPVNPVSNINSEIINWNTVKLSWQMTGIEENMPESLFISKKKDNLPIDENFASFSSQLDSFTDSSVELGHFYTYFIKGKLGSVFSGSRSTVINMQMLPPTNPSYEILSENSVKLSWVYNFQTSGFKIARQDNNGVWDENYAFLSTGKNIEKTNFQFTDNNIIFGHNYNYKVMANYNNFLSNPLTFSITHQLLTPTSLTAGILPDFKIKLNWEDSNLYHKGYSIAYYVQIEHSVR